MVEQPGWIGTVLQGKWRIDAKIARGGVATVFSASHRRGQRAAIKIMHPEFSRNADVRRRFLREGYAANKVGHPGVVKMLDDDVTDDGTAYIVMELLEHGELLETLREKAGGRLPVEEVARVCDQVLDVLAAAHEKGIIHRDIKPENIFVLEGGTVKVLDFGIAHIKEAALKAEPTATGLLLGTPEFMSPEQALGSRGMIDAQTDIYALGATMFTLLSGEAVHVYDALSALLVATSTRQARSLSSTKAKDLPREVIALVDKALMLQKHLRWPSAQAMRDALRKAVPQDYGPGYWGVRPAVEEATSSASLLPAPPPSTPAPQSTGAPGERPKFAARLPIRLPLPPGARPVESRSSALPPPPRRSSMPPPSARSGPPASVPPPPSLPPSLPPPSVRPYPSIRPSVPPPPMRASVPPPLRTSVPPPLGRSSVPPPMRTSVPPPPGMQRTLPKAMPPPRPGERTVVRPPPDPATSASNPWTFTQRDMEAQTVSARGGPEDIDAQVATNPLANAVVDSPTPFTNAPHDPFTPPQVDPFTIPPVPSRAAEPTPGRHGDPSPLAPPQLPPAPPDALSVAAARLQAHVSASLGRNVGMAELGLAVLVIAVMVGLGGCLLLRSC